MKKILLITFAFLMACSLNAQESHTYRFTLEDCLRYAFANSYERKSMALSNESLEATYQQSKLQRLPSLSASARRSYRASFRCSATKSC